MSTKEMLEEIRLLKNKIAMLPEGATAIGELTQALVALYDSYVNAIEKGRKKAA